MNLQSQMWEALPPILQSGLGKGIVAGGFLRDTVAGLPYLGDVDVYVKREDLYTLQLPNIKLSKALNTTLSTLYSGLIPFKHSTGESTIDMHLIVFEDNRDLFANVRETFDFVCCSAALSREEVWVHPTFEQDCKDRVLRFVDKGRIRHKIFQRIFKLVKKGWQIDAEQMAIVMGVLVGATKTFANCFGDEQALTKELQGLLTASLPKVASAGVGVVAPGLPVEGAVCDPLAPTVSGRRYETLVS